MSFEVRELHCDHEKLHRYKSLRVYFLNIIANEMIIEATKWSFQFTNV